MIITLKRFVLAAAFILALCGITQGAENDRAGLAGRWLFGQTHIHGQTVEDLAGSNGETILGPVRVRSKPARAIVIGFSQIHREPLTSRFLRHSPTHTRLSALTDGRWWQFALQREHRTLEGSDDPNGGENLVEYRFLLPRIGWIPDHVYWTGRWA